MMKFFQCVLILKINNNKQFFKETNLKLLLVKMFKVFKQLYPCILVNSSPRCYLSKGKKLVILTYTVRNYASSSLDSEVIERTEQRRLAKFLVSYIENNCNEHKYFRAIQNMQEELKNVVQEVEGIGECNII